MQDQIRRTLAGSYGLVSIAINDSWRRAHLRNVLSLDIEAVGLVRHCE